MSRVKNSDQSFLAYELRSQMLCLGERAKGGLFRPCAGVFGYCAVTGTLSAYFPQMGPLRAMARFVDGHSGNKRRILSFSPRDRARGLSIVPLEIEYLADVRAEVFVLLNEETAKFPQAFEISMGGMKSKGFGKCELERKKDVVVCKNPQLGTLRARIPEESNVMQAFGVRNVLRPIYGYLYRPTSSAGGIYQRSLFEGTRLVAYDILF